MKKLFLASYALETLELIRPLLSKSPTELKAVFIANAADPYEDKGFVFVEKDKLLEMGFEVIEIDLRKTQGEKLVTALTGIDVVLVAGGNTFYLLDQVRKSGFDVLVKKLVEKGVLYIGSSAGSIICCPTIEGAKRFDNPDEAPDLKDYIGLNLIDKILIPHSQAEKYVLRTHQTTKDMNNMGYDVIALTDHQAIIVEGKEIRVTELRGALSQ